MEETKNERYTRIANEILSLWEGNDQECCLGAVCTWIIKGTSIDKNDDKIRQLFKEFQEDYDLECDLDINTYLKPSKLEELNLREASSPFISLDGMCLNEVAQTIWEEASILGKIHCAAMVILHCSSNSHAFGLKVHQGLHLFDLALKEEYRASGPADMTLAIEIMITAYQSIHPSDRFTDIQIISYHSLI